MLNSHQPQQDSQQCLLCSTGKGLFMFNRMQIASHLSLTSKQLLTPLVSRKPEAEEHLMKISNPWKTRGCKRCTLSPLSDLHDSKDLTRLARSRASPRKRVVKSWKRSYCYRQDIRSSILLPSLQELSWKQPSDNLNPFPLLMGGACFCCHKKIGELWNIVRCYCSLYTSWHPSRP